MAKKLAPCGTYAAYVRHIQKGEQPDEACRLANSRYKREYRASRPDVRAREQAAVRARNRALELLAREYPARFLQIMDDLREKARTS